MSACDAFGRCLKCGELVTTGGCLKCDGVKITPVAYAVPIDQNVVMRPIVDELADALEKLLWSYTGIPEHVDCKCSVCKARDVFFRYRGRKVR